MFKRPTTARGAVRQTIIVWAVAFALLNGFMFYTIAELGAVPPFFILLNLGLHPLAIVYGYFEALRAYTGHDYDGQQFALCVAIVASVLALTFLL